MHLLAAAAIKRSGQSALHFVEQRLFTPLEIDAASWHWPTGPQGIVHGWGGLQLHPHAMAKIGQLFLNGGTWNGATLVSPEWIEQATGGGYMWGGLGGVYQTNGRGGQHIHAWPDRGLVVIATGSLDMDPHWYPGLWATLRSDTALPPNPDAHRLLMTAVANATKPPPPHPVPDLPPTATEISGEIYQLDANIYGFKCYSVRFDGANPSEASADITLIGLDGALEEFTLPIGMDGVPRFAEEELREFEVGAMGEWRSPTMFYLQYDAVGGIDHLGIEAEYSDGGEAVQMQFVDRTRYTATQAVLGHRVDGATCPAE